MRAAAFSLGISALLGASLAAVGCTAASGSKASGDDTAGATLEASTGDDASTCQSGSFHVDTYAPGLTKSGAPASGGEAGGPGLTFILESDEVGDAAASPAEPYTNVFTLKLMDSNNEPVTNATVLLPTNDQALGWAFSKDPWMPLHGHGSSVTPTIMNNGDGTYSISVYFFMPGFWQIYIVAETQTPAVTDSALFEFCLQ